MSYRNLEQRMIQTYLDTFPAFVPAENGPMVEAQNDFYQFLNSLYQHLFAEPTLLVRDLHEDDAYTHRFNKRMDNKPSLREQMNRVLKEIDTLLEMLHLLGRSGRAEHRVLVVDQPPKLKAKHRRVMAHLGLQVSEDQGKALFFHEQHTELPAAWAWMASRPGASLLSFSRCLFKDGYPYSRQIYGKLSGDEGAYGKLIGYLEENGYTYLQNLDGALSMDYVKTHDGQLSTKGGFLYSVRHIGISASCDVFLNHPPVFGLCIPQMKRVLSNFDVMDLSLQGFVAGRTKKCDNCRYCVQTDKSGPRPLAFVPVHHEGKRLHLCSYFPGYYYCWTRLDDSVVSNMIAMLDFMDHLLGADHTSAVS